MLSLARGMQFLMPDLAVVAPQGALTPHGRQWFPLRQLTDEEIWRGASSTAPLLDDFLDQEARRYPRIVLAGFSQGAIMALHAGLRRRRPPNAILAYSGFLCGHQHLDEIVSRPPVTLVHGENDPVVPLSAHHVTRDALQKLGIPVTAHVARGTGHTVDQAGAALGLMALRRALSG